MSGIYWLASYPKSGNTWLRAFLINYFADGDVPADINLLGGTIPSEVPRRSFDHALQIDSSLLTHAEIDQLRPTYYRVYATKTSPGNNCVKTHQRFAFLPSGEPLFPVDATAGVVYIVRNPLDVVISYANHNQNTIDDTIDIMNNEAHMLSNFGASIVSSLHEHLDTWSHHVDSWLDQAMLPMLTIRYEDISANPPAVFMQVLEFLGYERDPARVEKAVRFSSFDELRKQERTSGFSEKPTGLKSFFRKGKAGDWRDTLTREQIERIVRDHGAAMLKAGYPPPE